MKNQHGVTIIVLIIAVIILLILSGITIMFVTGDNGIISRANKSKEKMIVEQEKEQLELAYSDALIAKAENGDKSLVMDNEIQKQLDLKKVKANAVGYDPIKVTYEKTLNVYTINKNGKVNYENDSLVIDSEKNVDNNVNNEELVSVNSQSYGQSIYYPIDLNGDGNLSNDWKIFFNNGEDIFIIASDYISNTIPALNKETTKMTFDGSYVSYWENIPDFENLDENVLRKFMATGYTLNSENENSKCVSTLLNFNNWKEFVDSNYADYAIGSPTLEMWIESWNAKYGDKTELFFNKGQSGYYVGNSITTTDFSVNPAVITENSGYKEKLYFPHIEAYDGCYGYWLASPSANSAGELMYVGYNGSINIDNYGNSLLGIRPVISLKSDKELNFNQTTKVWEFSK